MKQRNAEILLIIVIASRSISYLLSKIGLNGIPPLELLAIRFALTTLILLLLFHRRLPLLTRQLCKAAGLLGTFLFACMACELISLTTIPSSTAAFLENTSAVWVLILMAVVSHHWPGKQVLTATSLLLIGIACLTLQGAVFHLAPGEIICLTGSVFYALWICLTARLARQYDPLLLGGSCKWDSSPCTVQQAWSYLKARPFLPIRRRGVPSWPWSSSVPSLASPSSPSPKSIPAPKKPACLQH